MGRPHPHGDGGELDRSGPARRGRRALEELEQHRDPDAGPFTLAVSHSAIPTEEEMDAYREVGVDWVLVAKWLDELDELVDALRVPS